MALQVRLIQPQESARWDAFVAAHPQGTSFHLTAWRDTIESTFPYQPRYVAAMDGDDWHGVLPLFLIQNRVMGRVLMSVPFGVYGGVLADSAEAQAAIREHLVEMARKLEVQYVDLRNAYPEQCVGFERISRYVTFSQPTQIGDSEQLLAALPKKTRNMVRKSLKFAYSTRTAGDLTAFYELLADTYRRHGTPVFPRKFFAAMLRNFGRHADLREVLLENRVVAVSLNFLFHGEMHTFYAASDQSLLQAAPNNYMYFDHLLWCARNGYARFDFGRSKLDTGTFEFKRHWLTEMRELPYEILLVKRKDLPNFTPKNPKFELALKVWRKLPLGVTKLVGPRVVGLFP